MDRRRRHRRRGRLCPWRLADGAPCGRYLRLGGCGRPVEMDDGDAQRHRCRRPARLRPWRPDRHLVLEVETGGGDGQTAPPRHAGASVLLLPPARGHLLQGRPDGGYGGDNGLFAAANDPDDDDRIEESLARSSGGRKDVRLHPLADAAPCLHPVSAGGDSGGSQSGHHALPRHGRADRGDRDAGPWRQAAGSDGIVQARPRFRDWRDHRAARGRPRPAFKGLGRSAARAF